MSKCRSCGERVVWAETVNGRRMPVDAEPSPMGNVTLEPRHNGPPIAHVASEPVAGGRLSHFASCKNADSFRRKR